MSEPRTEAGRSLLRWAPVKAADILAIEEQAATEARRELLAAHRALEWAHRWHGFEGTDCTPTTCSLAAVLDGLPVTDPTLAWNESEPPPKRPKYQPTDEVLRRSVENMARIEAEEPR
jgi:hypothetical protein